MFEIFGITFYGYGFLIGLGVWLTMEIALKRSENIKREVLERAMLWSVLGGVIGARIYHVVDYWSRYYSENIIKIFYLWEGGLGIWGALLGGALGLFVFCYFNKVKYVKFLDTLVVGIPLAQAIGRVGNYLNGELFGKNGEPLFFYEGVLNLFLFGALWKISQKKHSDGFAFGVYLIGYGVIRIALENLRPTENIWMTAGVPVAVIFGIISIIVGTILTFKAKK